VAYLESGAVVTRKLNADTPFFGAGLAYKLF